MTTQSQADTLAAEIKRLALRLRNTSRLDVVGCQEEMHALSAAIDRLRDLAASAQPVVADLTPRVFLVCTGEVFEGRETYTRHEGAPPPLCDFEGPLFAHPAPPAPAAEPFTPIQVQRLWNNSPEVHKDASSFAAFSRIVALVQAAHGITPKGST